MRKAAIWLFLTACLPCWVSLVAPVNAAELSPAFREVAEGLRDEIRTRRAQTSMDDIAIILTEFIERYLDRVHPEYALKLVRRDDSGKPNLHVSRVIEVLGEPSGRSEPDMYSKGDHYITYGLRGVRVSRKLTVRHNTDGFVTYVDYNEIYM